MPIQKCPLCLEEKAIIRSHLLPSGVYKFCRAPDSEPIIVTPEVVMQSSREIQDYLLCKDCDQMLSQKGENWLLPLLAEIDGVSHFTTGFLKCLPMRRKATPGCMRRVRIRRSKLISSCTSQWGFSGKHRCTLG